MAAVTKLAVRTRLFTLSDVFVVRWPFSCRTLYLSRMLRDKSTDSSVVPPATDHWKLIETVVSSLRTDCIAAAGLGLSRR